MAVDIERIRPVLARNKTDELADLLRRLIQEGQLAEGTKLDSERHLAEQLEVSRATVRQAFDALEKEGYLVTYRGRAGGKVVSNMEGPAEIWFNRMRQNPDDFEDLIEYRKAVESHVTRLAARRRSDDELLAMQRGIELLLMEEDGLSSFRQGDAVFHNAIGAASGSERLRRAQQIGRAQIMYPPGRLSDLGWVEDVRDQHRAILGAVQRQDEDQAASAAIAHVEHARVVLRVLFRLPA
jgi:GntR family transcriptional repressor for pyruvate dehydrogenase complex